MSLNLHSVVRGAIQAVNPDIQAVYLASLSYVQDTDGRQVPTYSAPVFVQIQVQPISTKDLQQVNYLNMQGVLRTVYLYGFPMGVDRVLVRGGDLLMFPQVPGATLDNWLITWVPEIWEPDTVGWSKAIVTLQTDGRLIVFSNGLPVLNANGSIQYN